MRCWAVQKCDWYQRVRELRRWGVLQRDRRKQRERVCFMPGGDVLDRFRGERVCELHRRDVFGGGGRELVGGMRELRDRDVFDHGRCRLFDGLHQLRGRDVLERVRRDKRERVCELPGGDDFVGRGKCVCLSCEYISKSRFTLHELSAQLELVCC